VALGDRWQSVADRWAASAGDAYYAFNDLHAAMAHARAGRDDRLRDALDAQHEALAADDDNAAFTREVGLPATQAVVAYVAGNAARAVELLDEVFAAIPTAVPA